ncbi:hypothetical protein NE237_024852 [Protea cynaroides]|uniref:Uncharacterized protein n=1 Tax=Protea cynaroides TaxID=273540 RepID=A0A9Q0H0N9_9MAGN|nr:hypothetical protein NE237_024852 [Protea cynaroides]
MASPSLLLGPPEIYLTTPSSARKSESTSSGDSLIDGMVSSFNNLTSKPPMGLTENLSPTFLATGNPCLDFFFHVVPDTKPEDLMQRLDLAWNHNALTTLKLVCNLRGVRGTGKSDKEGFYTAALWIHKNHPKTLACNVRWFADFGYFKDLPEILYRLIEGADVRRIKKEGRPADVRRIKKEGRPIRFPRRSRSRSIFRRKKFNREEQNLNREKQSYTQKRKSRSRMQQQERIAAAMEKGKVQKEKARDLRKEKIVSMAKKAVERYSRDPDYRFLHDLVSDVFAEFLVADLQFLKSEQLDKISLAAKWCPSLDSSFDRTILLCESIARRVFPRDSYPEYEGIEEAHYAYRIRDRLRKDYIVPLRKALELPEVYMSANLWNSLPYNRVASVAMKTYKEHFQKHDKERFEEYLSSVQRGEAKIAAGALLPHEIIASLNDDDGGKVSELQWQRMVDDMSKKGMLKNCIAVCDVSGSMSGTPMEVCVALGLLISELSAEPWKGKVITFSENPQLHMIEGNDLRSKTKFMREMDWGNNTDFQKVFDHILRVAIEGKLKEEQMIKRVLVFSDMEFDQAWQNKWDQAWVNNSGQASENNSDQASENNMDQASENNSDQASENNVDQASENNMDQASENNSDQASENNMDQASENNWDQASENNWDQASENNWDQALKKNWETDYEAIQRKFKESGYAMLPEIVFWNLRDSKATPVPSNQSGVALVSGFSKNLVTLFLEGDGVLSPDAGMELAISGEEYQKLVVFD